MGLVVIREVSGARRPLTLLPETLPNACSAISDAAGQSAAEATSRASMGGTRSWLIHGDLIGRTERRSKKLEPWQIAEQEWYQRANDGSHQTVEEDTGRWRLIENRGAR